MKMDFDATQAVDFAFSDDDEEAAMAAPEMPKAGFLEVEDLDNKDSKTEFPLFLGVNTIGRKENCTIVLNKKGISKKHAVIEIEKEVSMIYDLGSSNKTRKGKMILKPNVRYSIATAEVIFFSNIKSRFFLSTVESDTESVSSDLTSSASEVAVTVRSEVTAKNATSVRKVVQKIDKDQKDKNRANPSDDETPSESDFKVIGPITKPPPTSDSMSTPCTSQKIQIKATTVSTENISTGSAADRDCKTSESSSESINTNLMGHKNSSKPQNKTQTPITSNSFHINDETDSDEDLMAVRTKLTENEPNTVKDDGNINRNESSSEPPRKEPLPIASSSTCPNDSRIKGDETDSDEDLLDDRKKPLENATNIVKEDENFNKNENSCELPEKGPSPITRKSNFHNRSIDDDDKTDSDEDLLVIRKEPIRNGTSLVKEPENLEAVGNVSKMLANSAENSLLSNKNSEEIFCSASDDSEDDILAERKLHSAKSNSLERKVITSNSSTRECVDINTSKDDSMLGPTQPNSETLNLQIRNDGNLTLNDISHVDDTILEPTQPYIENNVDSETDSDLDSGLCVNRTIKVEVTTSENMDQNTTLPKDCDDKTDFLNAPTQAYDQKNDSETHSDLDSGLLVNRTMPVKVTTSENMDPNTKLPTDCDEKTDFLNAPTQAYDQRNDSETDSDLDSGLLVNRTMPVNVTTSENMDQNTTLPTDCDVNKDFLNAPTQAYDQKNDSETDSDDLCDNNDKKFQTFFAAPPCEAPVSWSSDSDDDIILNRKNNLAQKLKAKIPQPKFTDFDSSSDDGTLVSRKDFLTAETQVIDGKEKSKPFSKLSRLNRRGVNNLKARSNREEEFLNAETQKISSTIDFDAVTQRIIPAVDLEAEMQMILPGVHFEAETQKLSSTVDLYAPTQKIVNSADSEAEDPFLLAETQAIHTVKENSKKNSTANSITETQDIRKTVDLNAETQKIVSTLEDTSGSDGDVDDDFLQAETQVISQKVVTKTNEEQNKSCKKSPVKISWKNGKEDDPKVSDNIEDSDQKIEVDLNAFTQPIINYADFDDDSFDLGSSGSKKLSESSNVGQVKSSKVPEIIDSADESDRLVLEDSVEVTLRPKEPGKETGEKMAESKEAIVDYEPDVITADANDKVEVTLQPKEPEKEMAGSEKAVVNDESDLKATDGNHIVNVEVVEDKHVTLNKSLSSRVENSTNLDIKVNTTAADSKKLSSDKISTATLESEANPSKVTHSPARLKTAGVSKILDLVKDKASSSKAGKRKIVSVVKSDTESEPSAANQTILKTKKKTKTPPPKDLSETDVSTDSSSRRSGRIIKIKKIFSPSIETVKRRKAPILNKISFNMQDVLNSTDEVSSKEDSDRNEKPKLEKETRILNDDSDDTSSLLSCDRDDDEATASCKKEDPKSKTMSDLAHIASMKPGPKSSKINKTKNVKKSKIPISEIVINVKTDDNLIDVQHKVLPVESKTKNIVQHSETVEEPFTSLQTGIGDKKGEELQNILQSKELNSRSLTAALVAERAETIMDIVAFVADTAKEAASFNKDQNSTFPELIKESDPSNQNKSETIITKSNKFIDFKTEGQKCNDVPKATDSPEVRGSTSIDKLDEPFKNDISIIKRRGRSRKGSRSQDTKKGIIDIEPITKESNEHNPAITEATTSLRSTRLRQKEPITDIKKKPKTTKKETITEPIDTSTSSIIPTPTKKRGRQKKSVINSDLGSNTSGESNKDQIKLAGKTTDTKVPKPTANVSLVTEVSEISTRNTRGKRKRADQKNVETDSVKSLLSEMIQDSSHSPATSTQKSRKRNKSNSHFSFLSNDSSPSGSEHKPNLSSQSTTEPSERSFESTIFDNSFTSTDDPKTANNKSVSKKFSGINNPGSFEEKFNKSLGTTPDGKKPAPKRKTTPRKVASKNNDTETPQRKTRQRRTARGGVVGESEETGDQKPAKKAQLLHSKRNNEPESLTSGRRSPVYDIPSDTNFKVPASPRKRPKIDHLIMLTGLQDKDTKMFKNAFNVTEDVRKCTVLVVEKFKRTAKALCCVARGIPIVHKSWLVESMKNKNSLTDLESHKVKDRAAEKQFDFSLEETLSKSQNSPLLNGWKIHATDNTLPVPAQMEEIVECAGGVYLKRIPKVFSDKTIIISSDKDTNKLGQVCKLGLPIVKADFILSGVLQHSIDVEKHKLEL